MSLLRFSLMQDVAKDEEKIVVKVYFKNLIHAVLLMHLYDFVTKNTIH